VASGGLKLRQSRPSVPISLAPTTAKMKLLIRRTATSQTWKRKELKTLASTSNKVANPVS